MASSYERDTRSGAAGLLIYAGALARPLERKRHTRRKETPSFTTCRSMLCEYVSRRGVGFLLLFDMLIYLEIIIRRCLQYARSPGLWIAASFYQPSWRRALTHTSADVATEGPINVLLPTLT